MVHQTIVVLRHAERMDRQVGRPYVGVPFNSPLSDRGHAQASAVGDVLRDHFPDATWTVVASPFVRTLETAGHVMRGTPNTGTCYVEYGLCEHMDMATVPLGLDTLDAAAVAPFRVEFMEPRVLPECHEPIHRARERFSQTLRRLSNSHSDAPYLLLVTHGYAHQAAVAMGRPMARVVHVALCAYVVLSRTEPSFVLLSHPGIEIDGDFAEGADIGKDWCTYQKTIEPGGSLLFYLAT